ncbi:MAG: hypothetical protein RQ885_12140 [Desulfurococcales archaeon]|jgi:hypothetical protein|nr:hypothetical protein [Desulfurococcales archaeon]
MKIENNDHRTRLIIMSYNRIGRWIDCGLRNTTCHCHSKAERTSSKCPKCDTKGLEEIGCRKLRYPKMRFEEDRDAIGKLNIRKRILKILGIS